MLGRARLLWLAKQSQGLTVLGCVKLLMVDELILLPGYYLLMAELPLLFKSSSLHLPNEPLLPVILLLLNRLLALGSLILVGEVGGSCSPLFGGPSP